MVVVGSYNCHSVHFVSYNNNIQRLCIFRCEKLSESFPLFTYYDSIFAFLSFSFSLFFFSSSTSLRTHFGIHATIDSVPWNIPKITKYIYIYERKKNNAHTLTQYNQVYIVGHMPPGSDERQLGIQMNGHTTFSSENNLRYLQLVRKYSSIISGQFFGHLHSDSFRIIYNDNGKHTFSIYWEFSFFPLLFSCRRGRRRWCVCMSI